MIVDLLGEVGINGLVSRVGSVGPPFGLQSPDFVNRAAIGRDGQKATAVVDLFAVGKAQVEAVPSLVVERFEVGIVEPQTGSPELAAHTRQRRRTQRCVFAIQHRLGAVAARTGEHRHQGSTATFTVSESVVGQGQTSPACSTRTRKR